MFDRAIFLDENAAPLNPFIRTTSIEVVLSPFYLSDFLFNSPEPAPEEEAASVAALEAPVAALEAPVAALEAPVAALEAPVAALAAPVAALEAPVAALEAPVAALAAPRNADDDFANAYIAGKPSAKRTKFDPSCLRLPPFPPALPRGVRIMLETDRYHVLEVDQYRSIIWNPDLTCWDLPDAKRKI